MKFGRSRARSVLEQRRFDDHTVDGARLVLHVKVAIFHGQPFIP